MIARAMTFVEVAIAAEVEQVEFVDQAVTLQQVYGAVDRHLRDARIQFAGAFKDLSGVEVAAGRFHHLQKHAALAREAYATSAEFALEASGRFVIDAFAGGDAMCGSGGHRLLRDYSKSRNRAGDAGRFDAVT